MTDISSAIQKKYPEADLSIVQELCNLIDQHHIEYVVGKDGGVAFVLNRLCEAKGLSAKDFKNFIEKGETAPRNIGSTPGYSYKLSGRFVLLNGDQLRVFKKLWAEEGNKVIGARAGTVWVCNWEGAYSYLVQGSTEIAKDIQTLGSKAIEKATKPAIQTAPESKSALRSTPWSSEEELSAALTWLSAQSPYNLQVEISVKDYPQSKCRTRRIDLIHESTAVSKSGRLVTAVEAYELKKDSIDYEDVEEVVSSKRYRELVKLHYNTTHVKFYLVAFSGGTPEALERVKDFDDVEILTVAEFSEFLLEQIAEWHQNDRFYIGELRKNSSIVQKLLTPCKELPSSQPCKVIPFSSRARLKEAV